MKQVHNVSDKLEGNKQFQRFLGVVNFAEMFIKKSRKTQKSVQYIIEKRCKIYIDRWTHKRT